MVFTAERERDALCVYHTLLFPTSVLRWQVQVHQSRAWMMPVRCLLNNEQTSIATVSCLFLSLRLLQTGTDPGFGQGGPQLLRPKVANVAKWSRTSEASILWPGSRAHLRALEAFGFLMLKYAFSHILETLFLLFLTSILTPKVDKNRALDFTSINLRHSDMLHLFFNLHEKVML